MRFGFLDPLSNFGGCRLRPKVRQLWTWGITGACSARHHRNQADTDCACRLQLRPANATAVYRVRVVTGLLYSRAHDANALGSATSSEQNIRPSQALA